MNVLVGLHRIEGFGRVLPGLALCLGIAIIPDLLKRFGLELEGRPFLDPVVLAILLGASIRWIWCPGPLWEQGITCGAKLLLEMSVVLLGASIDAAALTRLGPLLVLSVGAIVTAAATASYALGRACGLPPRLSVLVACGNSICGNAAIGAVAPMIGADARDMTAAVSFTAVLGLGVVVCLPGVIHLLDLTSAQYGELAGLTVYSVPQVLAATLPVSILSSQVGTMIKLLRVAMLGPMVVILSCLMASRRRQEVRRNPRSVAGQDGPFLLTPVATLVPWFLVGFVALASCRSLGLLPSNVLGPIGSTGHLLTIVSMAALGLNVDLRMLARCGNRIAMAVSGSLVVLFVMSITVVRVLPVL